MRSKKIIAAICCGTLMLPSVAAGTAKGAEAATKPKEYIIHAENDRTYEKITEQYEEEITEDQQGSPILEDANIAVAELTIRQAKSLEERDGVTVEPNIMLDGESKDTVTAEENTIKKDIRKLAKEKWNISAISADSVKKTSKRRKISIAILDSGMDTLSDIPFENQVSLIPEEDTEDMTGHGTIIANLIASNRNGSCQSGILPKNAPVNMHSVRILDENNQTPLSRVLEGLQWCIDNKIDIVNMSFGTETQSDIFRDMIKKAVEAGILIVSSVGNSGEKKQGITEYPANYPEVIGVGSIDENMEHSTFSNTGTAVELTAPGENIPITSYWGIQGAGSGTSYAAAHVTAVSALLWSEHPGKSASDIRTLMDKSATAMGSPEKYGYGIINYQNASRHPELAENWEEISNGEEEEQHPNEILKPKTDNSNPDAFTGKPKADTGQNSLVQAYEIPISLKASWGKPKHANLIPAVNGMTTHELDVVRAAVQHADDKSTLGKYDILHARKDTNYVAAAKVFFQASKKWNGNASSLNGLAGAYSSSAELGTTKAETYRDLKTVMNTAATVNLENTSQKPTVNRGKLQLLGMALHVAGDAYAHKCMCDGSKKGQNDIQRIYNENKDIKPALMTGKSIGDIKKAAASKNGLTTARLGTGYFKNTDVSNYYYTDSVKYMKERYSVATKVATNKLLHYYSDKNGTFTPFVFCPYEISKTSNYKSNYGYRLRNLVRYLKDAKYNPESATCLKGKNTYSKSDWKRLSFD